MSHTVYRAALLGAVLSLTMLPAAARADAGLDAASRRFPALITGPTIQPAGGVGQIARSCPAPGARVEQRGGPTILYEGSDPANPDLCRMRINGTSVSGWFGIWLTDWPGADQANAALRRLIRGHTGDTEGFVVRMSADRTYYDILRNEGVEDLHVLNHVYHTIKVSHYREAAAPNTYRSVVTGWKDIKTGMLIYVTYQHIAGAPETGTPLDPTAIMTGP